MPLTFLATARPALPFNTHYSELYDGGSATANPTPGVGTVLILLGLYLLVLAIIWLSAGLSWAGVFAKAGHPKWAAFVPLYNTWLIVKISGRPASSFWLQFIPYAGLYWAVVSLNDLAKSFGKDAAYTVGLLFLPIIFASMLSYGQAKYLGPAYVSAEQKLRQQYAQGQYLPQQYGAPASNPLPHSSGPSQES